MDSNCSATTGRSAEDISKIYQSLEEIIKKQSEYENLYLQTSAAANLSVCENAGDAVIAQGKHLQEISDLITTIQVSVESLSEKVGKNERWLDSLEQYSRSNCLILHGSQPPSPSTNDYTSFEKHVMNTINANLDLPTPITNTDIDICHPLPSHKNKNPVIVKFVRRSVRNLVYSHKKDLKKVNKDLEHKLSITESLTKRRLRLLGEARKVFQFQNVWSINGEIFCSFAGQKHHIDDFHDINRIRFQ